MTNFNLTPLRQLIVEHFSLDQFKTLCQDLDIDFDNLEGEDSKESKVRELIKQLQRTNRLEVLIERLQESRPTVNWVRTRKSGNKSELDFPIHELPFPRNPNLTGRGELFEQLHNNLNGERKPHIPQAIVGLGGVGKTQVALEYAYRHAGEYDLIWWIRAETAETLTADYITLANKLELDVITGAEQTVFVNIVHYWLKRADERWLLIFDNAEEPEKLKDFLPQGEKGHILITSQNPNWSSVATVFQLGVFSPYEAQNFLQHRTGQTDEVSALKLAAEMGYLPLSLEQACAFMTKRGTPITVYLKLFQEQRSELWKREVAPYDYKKTITTTWELAFQEIRKETEAAIELLNICIFLAPEEIPINLFVNGVEYLPHMLAEAVNDPFGLEDSIAALNRYSLAQRSENTLSIHRLVQDVAREQLGTERAKSWVETTLQLVNKSFIFDEYSLATWPESTQLLSHVTSIGDWAEEYGTELETIGNMQHKLAKYLRIQGEYLKAQAVVEQTLALRRKLFGEEHPYTAESLDYLGELLQDQARFDEAKPCHQQALIIREKILGPDHPDTATSLNNLGVLLNNMGDYMAARSYFQLALAIRERALGSDHPDTAISLSNLGKLLSNIGDYAEAQSYGERAFAIYEKVLGPNHPFTAISLNSLGGDLSKMGDYAEAKSCYERALAIHEKALGFDHPGIALILNDLGVLLDKMGDYAEVPPCYERALAIYEKALGLEHPHTATSLYNLGTCLVREGKRVQARPMLERALKIYERLENPRHPRLVPILFNLGAVLVHLRQFTLARQYLGRAREICKNREVDYEECQQIEQMWKGLPGKIGKPKRKRKKK